MRPHPHRAQMTELVSHPDPAVQEKARSILAAMDVDPASIPREPERVMHVHGVTMRATGLLSEVTRARIVEELAARRALSERGEALQPRR